MPSTFLWQVTRTQEFEVIASQRENVLVRFLTNKFWNQKNSVDHMRKTLVKVVDTTFFTSKRVHFQALSIEARWCASKVRKMRSESLVCSQMWKLHLIKKFQTFFSHRVHEKTHLLVLFTMFGIGVGSLNKQSYTLACSTKLNKFSWRNTMVGKYVFEYVILKFWDVCVTP